MGTKFTASQFTATEWDTAEDKAKFANHFVRFVESDFKASIFPKWFYNRLSMTFGHIAHYNQAGFFATFFTTPEQKMHFFRCTMNGGGYGDPKFTYCDVENAIKNWLKDSGIVGKYQKAQTEDFEAKERALFTALKAKYEAASA